jgi:hypothetical protein
MTSPPFVDRDANELDIGQIWTEVVPLAGLIVLFGLLSLVPFLLALLVGGTGGLALLFTVVGQFVLAIGGATVLTCVVAWGIRPAGE